MFGWMNEDISGMTENEISAEIAELQQLARKGEITPSGAMRLDALQNARRRIGQACRDPWHKWLAVTR